MKAGLKWRVLVKVFRPFGRNPRVTPVGGFVHYHSGAGFRFSVFSFQFSVFGFRFSVFGESGYPWAGRLPSS
jgi:hypothetical protein